MYYIGIDLGTSAVKLLLMDEKGTVHKVVSKEYPICFPASGLVRASPEDWYAQSIEGIRELTADCEKEMVAGIAAAGRCTDWWHWMTRTG